MSVIFCIFVRNMQNIIYNEITAIPQLLRSLDLEGCIVTIDAMGCQKEITREIIERKSDYVIALKENQPKSLEEAKEILADYEDSCYTDRHVSRHVSENTGHGRAEIRTCTVVSYGEKTERIFKNRFVGLRSVVSLKSERITLATGEHTVEYRYYITSLDNTNPEEIASAIREHWSIENHLHWQLDVSFREDQSRKVKNAARNYSAVTKMALAVLKSDKTTKGSINLKRLKAGWDENYLSQLLNSNAF